MTPRPGTVLRPTARGVVVALVAAAAWLLADLTRVVPARYLAAALLLALVVGLVSALLGMIGLRAERQVIDDAVSTGDVARVQLDLAPGALITWLPLGRGAVREHLPAALGGTGDLALARSMPHLLHVTVRGNHELGPYSLVLRDVFGLFHLRRTATDAARITGLPVVGELTHQATTATGITRDGTMTAATNHGVGEIGPIARPYATGDDIRRIHWRASARVGELMTREEEPSAGQTAVIVLDTTRRDADTEVEDRLVSHAATALESLGLNGWEVRVLDASGDEITRTTAYRGVAGFSPLGHEADAVASRASLLALAQVGFDDDPADSRLRTDHAAGHTALAIALGIDDGDPFDGLELDRFAGRASHRTAIALRPAPARADGAGGSGTAGGAPGSGAARWTRRVGPGDGEDFGMPRGQQTGTAGAGSGRGSGRVGSRGTDAADAKGGSRAKAGSRATSGSSAPGADAGPAEPPAPTRTRRGAWSLVRGTTADSLSDLLSAADRAEPVGPRAETSGPSAEPVGPRAETSGPRAGSGGTS